MNFIKYAPETGDVIETGYMEQSILLGLIESGEPFLLAYNILDFKAWKVNLQTKELEPVS